MTEMQEIITVTVNGQRYASWKRSLVQASLKEAARSFRFEVAAEDGPAATAVLLKAGTPVGIYANNDLVLAGYIDRRRPQLDGRSGRIVISGRSKSADMIDCSAVHSTGRFENKTIAEIGDELAPDGPGFTCGEPLDPVPYYQVTPGESQFIALNKMARAQGKVLTGQADGTVKIHTPGKNPKRHAGGIVEGDNLKIGESDHNSSGRYSKYIVRGQGAAGHGPDSLEIEATARDSAVGRNRTLLVIQDDETDAERAKAMARNRRDRAAGAALTATLTVQGFRDAAGKIWEPGYLVWVESPFLDIAQDMLIETVILAQDPVKGTEAQLQVVDPRSYGGKKSKGNKSGDDWQQDSEDAE